MHHGAPWGTAVKYCLAGVYSHLAYFCHLKHHLKNAGNIQRVGKKLLTCVK